MDRIRAERPERRGDRRATEAVEWKCQQFVQDDRIGPTSSADKCEGELREEREGGPNGRPFLYCTSCGSVDRRRTKVERRKRYHTSEVERLLDALERKVDLLELHTNGAVKELETMIARAATAAPSKSATEEALKELDRSVQALAGELGALDKTNAHEVAELATRIARLEERGGVL
jgi:hypothetical protein